MSNETQPIKLSITAGELAALDAARGVMENLAARWLAEHGLALTLEMTHSARALDPSGFRVRGRQLRSNRCLVNTRAGVSSPRDAVTEANAQLAAGAVKI